MSDEMNNDATVSEHRLYTMGDEIGVSGAAVAAQKFVKLNAANKWIECTALTDIAGGVSITAATAVDQQITVRKSGTANVLAGAAVTLGGVVGPDGTGRAIDTAIAGTDRANAVARTGGTGAGVVTVVELCTPGAGWL